MVEFRIPGYLKWGFLSLLVLIAATDSVIDYFYEVECRENNVVVPVGSLSGEGMHHNTYSILCIILYHFRTYNLLNYIE